MARRREGTEEGQVARLVAGAPGAGGDVFRKAHHGLTGAEKLGSEEQAPIGLALTEDAIYGCSSSVKGLRRLALKDR